MCGLRGTHQRLDGDVVGFVCSARRRWWETKRLSKRWRYSSNPERSLNDERTSAAGLQRPRRSRQSGTGGDFGWLEKAGEPIKKTLVAFAKTVGGNRSIVYRLAGRAVYCQRDVMNFADKVMRSGDPAHYLPENNRADASSNDVIDEFLGVLSSEDADRIEMLAAGGDADITIHEAFTDGDAASSCRVPDRREAPAAAQHVPRDDCQ